MKFSTNESIFDSTQQIAENASKISSGIAEKAQVLKEIPYADSNDTLSSLWSILPKDPTNIVEGGSTYGMYEFLHYFHTSFIDFWLYLAEDIGMGMGFGLLTLSLIAKGAFTPFMLYT